MSAYGCGCRDCTKPPADLPPTPTFAPDSRTPAVLIVVGFLVAVGLIMAAACWMGVASK